MNEQPAILIIHTGGTIGMSRNPETGALEPVDFNNLTDLVPTLKLFNYQIDHYKFNPLIDSANMSPQFWKSLAGLIYSKYEAYDGFVILHGSDTMAYTSSALSFMLQNLNKPVVLTGSQLPLGMIRTDGRENLLTAIEIAAAYEEEMPVVPEVCVCFENRLFRGNRTHKISASDFDAFASPNYPELASAGVSLKFNRQYIRKPNFKKLRLKPDMEPGVMIVKLFPGLQQSFLKKLLQFEGLKGVVLESYGSGNAPTDKEFTDILRAAVERGIVVLNITQCEKGGVEMGRYATSRQLIEAGVRNGFDMTSEAALTKMMHLLGSGYRGEKLGELLEKPMVGEMTIV
ncbi:MAG: asparaginase [Bacteroidales bacterium]